MNSKLRQHFEGRFENLDPVLGQRFTPGEGWRDVASVPPTPANLTGMQTRGATMVSVRPYPGSNVLADFSIRELLEADPAPVYSRKGRAALTSHQRELFERLVRLSGPGHRAVASANIGSRGGMEHLVRKGYVEESTVYGPRGGRTYTYLPLP